MVANTLQAQQLACVLISSALFDYHAQMLTYKQSRMLSKHTLLAGALKDIHRLIQSY